MKTIELILGEDSWRYPAMEMLQAFDPSAEICFAAEKNDKFSGYCAFIHDDILHLDAFEENRIALRHEKAIDPKTFGKEDFKRAFYLLLSEIYNRMLPWGTLTGIKPVKIAHELMREGQFTTAEASAQMQQLYFVSPQKADLAAGLAEREMCFVYPKTTDFSEGTKVSVYLGVPVCPAKCSYCSFVSTVADAKGELAAAYLEGLLAEIDAIRQMMREHHLITDTLYIGGGTPSIFSADQLRILMSAMQGELIHSNLREFTFEAGRPETTTIEKLKVMKDFGVDRICLNPQSMNNETLAAVNRHHTREDIISTLQDIRQVGFQTVNMDLIVGLAGERPAAFLSSLDAVIDLAPENLTVHSLAVKHGSAIREQSGHQVVQFYDEAFYERIRSKLSAANYQPYYLYRQKYTQGSGENIGYCKPGHEGIYNILMMAERQTIIGIGAGSSGKIYDPVQNRFEKVFTVKDIRTYNQRVNDLIRKKIEIYDDFYRQGKEKNF